MKLICTHLALASATLTGALIMGCAQANPSGANASGAPGTPASPGATAASAAPLTQERAPMIPVQLKEAVQAAVQDAARRSGRSESSLKVALAEWVTWPNGSMGCPAPGRMYTQALIPGYRIRIEAGAETLEYHGGKGGQPAYCPPERTTNAIPSTNS